MVSIYCYAFIVLFRRLREFLAINLLKFLFVYSIFITCLRSLSGLSFKDVRSLLNCHYIITNHLSLQALFEDAPSFC